MKTNRRRSIKGQGFLEFSFAMMVIVLMVYGIICVFRWTGVDLAEGRLAHERQLLDDGTSKDQILPNYFIPTAFDAIWEKFSP